MGPEEGVQKTDNSEELDLSLIDLKSLKDKDLLAMDEIRYNPRNHHGFKVLNTLMLLAECYAFKLKTAHACEIYDFVCDGYEQLFGTRETVLHSYAQQ